MDFRFIGVLGAIGGIIVLMVSPLLSVEEEGIIVNNPKFIDLDGDGFSDIIGTDDTPRIRVYLNDGTGHFTDTGQRLGQTDVYCFDVAIMYQSGSICLLAGEDEQCSIYTNDGTGTFSMQSEIEYSFETKLVATGDIDGDNDVDIAFSHAAGIIIYENNGVFNFSATSNSFSISNPGSMGFKDVESDFDLDLVTVDVTRVTKIYFNDGTGTFTE